MTRAQPLARHRASNGAHRGAHRDERPDDDLDDDVLARDMQSLKLASAENLPTLATLATTLNENRSQTRNGKLIMTDKEKSRKLWLRLAAVAFVLAVAGAVFATTQSGAISFWVDTEGKTDEQVEDEITDQLEQSGSLDNAKVKFKRDGDTVQVKIKGNQGERKIKLVREETGGDQTVVQMHHEPLDTEREPGMTDEQLEAKIQAQLEARGMTGTVEVHGDQIRIRAEQEVEAEGDDSDSDPDFE